jgi:hypothetical protein
LAFNAKVPDIAEARRALTRVLRSRAWACYASPLGAVRQPKDFVEWVTAHVPQGLQTTLDNLKQIAKGDKELTDALDGALAEQYPHGGDRSNRSFKLDNIQLEDSNNYPDGTSQARALRKLRRDRPDLHARVLLPKDDPQRLSANKAMITAGYRRRTLTVRADDPEHAARTLRTYYGKNPEQLALLIKHLKEEKEN